MNRIASTSPISHARATLAVRQLNSCNLLADAAPTQGGHIVHLHIPSTMTDAQARAVLDQATGFAPGLVVTITARKNPWPSRPSVVRGQAPLLSPQFDPA